MREHNYFHFTVSFAVLYTHTHTHLHTPTHTLIYIPTTTTNQCVCSSEDRRLNKIKFDNQHYALQLFLFGKHNIALTTLVPQVRSACQQESGCSESATPPPISDLIGSTSTNKRGSKQLRGADGGE